MYLICETAHSFCEQATMFLDISEMCSTQTENKTLSTSKRCFFEFETVQNNCMLWIFLRLNLYATSCICMGKQTFGLHAVNKSKETRYNFHKFSNFQQSLNYSRFAWFISYFTDSVTFACDVYLLELPTGQASSRCAVRPDSLVLLFDGIYCPKMKGANWLKLMCSQGKSQVNIFSLWNIWYKSVVPSPIWLHRLVCQIHNKQCHN